MSPEAQRLLDELVRERDPMRRTVCTSPSEDELCAGCWKVLRQDVRRGCGGCGGFRDQHSDTCPVIA